tara:strand:- start:1530 stop:3494 length:1965 start_codon:yes stop_codon:yes gene_type:complete
MKDLNILVVVPRIVARAGDWYQPPLGLGYISAVLKEAGFSVSHLNLNESDEPTEIQIASFLKKNAVDVAMTGGVTGQYTAVVDVLAPIKAFCNDIVTVVGGGIITSLPKEAMEALELADFGIIGEGEIIIVELLKALTGNADLSEVPGIVYKNKDNVGAIDIASSTGIGTRWTRNDLPLPKVDITKLPYPDYEAIGFSQLSKVAPNILGMSELQTLPIVTSRGCPFACTFCYQPDGQAYRMRELDDVFEEIDYLVEKYQVSYLSLTDELFGARKGRVEEFCERIKPYNIKWTATFRIPQLTPTVVQLLKDANFHTASLGIESMDDTVLKSMQKKITRQQTEDGLRLLHEAGIGIQGVLIFGDPVETKETIQNTLDWWLENTQYDLQLSAIIAYPGTPVYDHAVDKGLIPDPVRHIKEGCPLVKLSDMPQSDYTWMFEQILSLPRRKYPQPLELYHVHSDFAKATCNWKGKCSNCSADNQWTSVKTFMLEAMTCNACGTRHIAPIPRDFAKRIQAAYDSLSEAYGDISFWGINSYFHSFISEYGSWMKDYYLLDQSEARIGITMRPSGSDKDVEIRHPDNVLKDGKSRCVVVAVPNYYSNIKTFIEETYPGVEKVLSILDLVATGEQIEFPPYAGISANARFVRPDLEGAVLGKA